MMNSETEKLALKHAQYLKMLDEISVRIIDLYHDFESKDKGAVKNEIYDVFGELAMYSFHLENMHNHTIKLLKEAEK